MKEINVTRLPGATRVIQEAPAPLPLTLRSRIEEIWLEAIATRPHLFNGKIFILSGYKDGNLHITESEYKFSFSKQKFPELFNDYSITILAVTGVLRCADGLILGRRGNSVNFQSGLWEPAPAGSLSCPDPQAQVLEELGEELGLGESEITTVKMLGLIEDKSTGIADLIFEITTPKKFSEIMSKQEHHKYKEHDEICCIKITDIASFLSENRGKYIPILPDTLKLAGLI